MAEVEASKLLEALQYIEQYARYIRVCAEALEKGDMDVYEVCRTAKPVAKPPVMSSGC